MKLSPTLRWVVCSVLLLKSSFALADAAPVPLRFHLGSSNPHAGAHAAGASAMGGSKGDVGSSAVGSLPGSSGTSAASGGSSAATGGSSAATGGSSAASGGASAATGGSSVTSSSAAPMETQKKKSFFGCSLSEEQSEGGLALGMLALGGLSLIAARRRREGAPESMRP